MPQLDTLSQLVYPCNITNGILNVLDRNKVNLKNMTLWIAKLPGQITLDLQLSEQESSQVAIQSLEALTVDRCLDACSTEGYVDLSRLLRGVYNKFDNLVTLDFKNFGIEGMSLFINILQNLSCTIEIFPFDRLYMWWGDIIQSFETTERCKVKKLKTDFDLTVPYSTPDTANMANRILKFILESCPLLVKFGISGRLGLHSSKKANYVLDLRFFSGYNSLLKSIDVDPSSDFVRCVVRK